MDQNLTTKEILSLDTPWDRLVHRPPARLIATFLSRTSITPNQVTLLTLIPAALCALFFIQSNLVSGFWALLSFYLWAMLDHVDGELARRTGRCSPFGRKLDDVCDNVGSLAILSGIFGGTLRLLEGKHQLIVSLIFLIGLVLNLISGVLVLSAKRAAREEAVKHQTATQKFMFFQKLLDHMTGRDPFYLLVSAALWALYWRGNWGLLLITCLLIGLYAISFGAFAAWWRMKIKPVVTP
ncbi:MAG: CDP-alcohol phosphatidyltransferase family protein [Candidatus Omnitrophica bacterium]|nr:CDP-alcohol phosphatidyltransferase family protein [Candidatus Omnitrophota bacterium]